MSGLRDIRMQTGWLGKLDAIGHFLRVPHWLMRPVCDKYEKRLADGSPYVFIGGQWMSTTSSSSASNGNVTWTVSGRKDHRE